MAARRASRRAPALALLLLALLAALPSGGGQPPADDAPLAYFSLSPDPPGTGETVTADGSSSLPGPGARRIVEYAWSWSDGQPFVAGNATATHRYSADGWHVVSLRVTDDVGAVAVYNRTLLVQGARPLAEAFIDSITERDGDLVVVVTGEYSQPSQGATRIVTYEWNWGDGSGFREGNVTETHVYTEPGNYTITLRVTDDEGRVAEEREPVVFRSTFFERMLRVWDQRDAFIDGAKLTILLAVGTTVAGFVLAIAVALMRISRFRVLRWPAATYIEVIRGTPLLVQILIAWLVLPFFGILLPALWAGALALIVNTSAYQAEAIRGGIQSIPTGQMEAATSLGMTYMQSMRHVVVPQAFRLTLPPLGNEFIILLKDTSLVSAIGVYELTQVGKIFSGQTFLVLETWLAVALVYFVLTYAMGTGLRYLEKRLAIPGLGMSTGGA